MGSIHLLDEEAKSFFGDKSRFLYRYINKDYIKDIDKLVFSNPFNKGVWRDPFERWYIEAEYKLGDEKSDYRFKDRVLCLCFTTKNHNEAFWKADENNNSRIIKLKYDSIYIKGVLGELDEFEVYAGAVKYLYPSDFNRNTPARSLRLGKTAFYDDETWVRLLFLKRSAFEYENEFRIVLITKEANEVSLQRKLIPINCSVSKLIPEAYLLSDEKGNIDCESASKLRDMGIESIKPEKLYEIPAGKRYWNLNRTRIGEE